MKKTEYKNWKALLTSEAKRRFGLELNDIGEEDRFRRAFDEGDTVKEFLDDVARRYDLDEIA